MHAGRYVIQRAVAAIAVGVALSAAAPVHSLHAQAKQMGADAQPAVSAELAAVRTKLEKYRDPIAAVFDGYFSTLACVSYPEGATEGPIKYVPGAMGVHFLNPALIGTPLDPEKPQVLIYEPRGEKLELVAAEWFVPVAASGGTRPSIFGKEFEGPMEGHEPFMPATLHHYDLHVWLWKANPAGVFHSTNPEVKCPKGAYSFNDKVKPVKHH